MKNRIVWLVVLVVVVAVAASAIWSESQWRAKHAPSAKPASQAPAADPAAPAPAPTPSSSPAPTGISGEYVG